MQTKTFLKCSKSLLAALTASSVLVLAGCSGNPPTTQLAIKMILTTGSRNEVLITLPVLKKIIKKLKT